MIKVTDLEMEVILNYLGGRNLIAWALKYGEPFLSEPELGQEKETEGVKGTRAVIASFKMMGSDHETKTAGGLQKLDLPSAASQQANEDFRFTSVSNQICQQWE